MDVVNWLKIYRKGFKLKRYIACLLLFFLLINICSPFNAFCAGDEEAVSSSLSILSNIEGGSLYIDGKDTGLRTPLAEPVTVEPGFHSLRIEKEGHTTWRQQLLLSPGEIMTLTAVSLLLDVSKSQKEAFKSLGKEPITKSWWFWTVLVVAGVAAVSSGGQDGGSGSSAGDVLVTW